MLNLIKKEFIIQKKYLFYYIFYSIFIFVIFSMSSNESAKSAYILAAVSVTYIFIQYSCAIEDRNNSERILNSLPISKKSIVLSKYFSLMIFSIIAVILSIVSGYIISKLDFIKVELIGIIDIVTIFFIVSILAGLYFPVYYKFGYIKAKILNIIIFLGFFSSSMLVGQLLKHFAVNDMMNSASAGTIGRLFSEYGDMGIYIILLGIGLLILIVSALLSITIYKRKEFN